MTAPRRLEDRVAVVTGAASGIGAGIARRLVADGARCVLDVNGHCLVVDGTREVLSNRSRKHWSDESAG